MIFKRMQALAVQCALATDLRNIRTIHEQSSGRGATASLGLGISVLIQLCHDGNCGGRQVLAEAQKENSITIE